MSEANSYPDETVPEQDRQLFQMLDRYVELLHSGDVNSRSQLLDRQPELAELLGCLDTLEMLAPSPEPDWQQPAESDADAPTLALESGSATTKTSSSTIRAKPSRQFGKYELLAEIGRGGMGVVFKAQQVELNRIVALKMILSSRLASDDEIRRFYSEAKAAGSLQHPNIVGIHEVGEIHGQHYFTMDYVEGRSLADILREGPLDPDQAATDLATIARAVDHLHKNQIIHRDLKPANILLDESGTPHVTDFGLAKVFEQDSQQTRTGTIVGTPSYMAPEQAAGRHNEVAVCSDVYSLGAILFEMLTGQPPFKEDNPLDTLVQVLEGEPPLPSKLNRRVPRELELICLRCLEKDPSQRYQSSAELADDLDRYLKREPIAARPTGLFQKFRRWGRREPALVSRLGGLLATGGIVQIRYSFVGTDLPYHLRVMSVLGVWAIVCFVCQQMLHRERLADFTRFAWAAADAVLLTTVLYLARADGPLGPLVIGYPLLVAASGLFFRVRLVWFMTFASLVSYAALMIARPEQTEQPHYAIIFAATLAILGFIVAYQVYRVRVLSRYYEHRRLP